MPMSATTPTEVDLVGQAVPGKASNAISAALPHRSATVSQPAFSACSHGCV
jgi:hypothetical protein